MSAEQTVQSILEEKNAAQYREAYLPDQMLVIDEFLPKSLVSSLYWPEIEACAPHVHRVSVPGFKKSGSTSHSLLRTYAPNLAALYQSDLLKSFVEGVVGERLMRCPDEDPHAAALYHYTEPGDRIGVHYDKSFYKGRRYTLLLGMIQDSTASKLVCYPGATKKNRRKNPLPVLTHPGTLVVFNGDVLWHEVTALAENERRVILTLEYVTDARMSPIQRAISNFKDRMLYFGKNHTQPQETE